MLIPISDPGDPRLAPYLAVRERDLIRRDGLFIVEGKVTLGRLIDASRFAIHSVFLADSRPDPLAGALAKLDPHVPVYVAPQALMDQVAGFHLHRGVLALAHRGEDEQVADLLSTLARGAPSVSALRTDPPPPLRGGGLPSADRAESSPTHVGEVDRGAQRGETEGALPPLTVLALVNLSNHDNVGACFRNAAALGADAVLLDAQSCDPFYRKAIRVSAGTALSLPFARSGSGAEMLAALAAHDFETWALTPFGGEALQSLRPPPRLALMLGAEGPGLPADLMARAHRVSIPMAPGVDSLNVAAAGAIALAHVYAARINV